MPIASIGRCVNWHQQTSLPHIADFNQKPQLRATHLFYVSHLFIRGHEFALITMRLQGRYNVQPMCP
jgi:hypothetical protein